MRNRQLSLEIQLSGNNNGLYTTDGTEEHVNSLLTPVSASSLNSLPLGQYDATNENPEFMQKALPSLKNVCGETYSGKETSNVSNTSSTSPGIFVSSHYHESELQDEVVFYQDQCHEPREKLIKLKEKLKLCEEEKQNLQAEVGRQLFLESKERQCSKKVYQPPSKHASERSKPDGVRGASHDFSGADVRRKGGAGPLERAGKYFFEWIQCLLCSR